MAEDQITPGPDDQPPATEPAPVAEPPAASQQPLQPVPERVKPRRSLWGLIGILALIALVILVLLLLRDCARQSGNDDAAKKGKHIVSVEGLQPVDGAVSLWIKPGREVAQVVENAGVRTIDQIDMNGGRYVLLVRRGTEEDAVKALAALSEDVYDAGLVYQRPISSGVDDRPARD